MMGGLDSNNCMHTIAYDIYIATSVDDYTDDVQLVFSFSIITSYEVLEDTKI
jgi:hypothetical protein